MKVTWLQSSEETEDTSERVKKKERKNSDSAIVERSNCAHVNTVDVEKEEGEEEDEKAVRGWERRRKEENRKTK